MDAAKQNGNANGNANQNPKEEEEQETKNFHAELAKLTDDLERYKSNIARLVASVGNDERMRNEIEKNLEKAEALKAARSANGRNHS